MKIPENDLLFAVSPIIPVIDNLYRKFLDDPLTPPYDTISGVKHLRWIDADPRLIAEKAAEDRSLRKLFEHLFSKSLLYASLDKSEDGTTGIISFRGTEKLIEWVDDFLFAAVPFTANKLSAMVHAGFLRVYELVRSNLLANLNLLDGTQRIIVTGHSLGAAVATICAFDFTQMAALPKIDCWTFASPRVFFGSTKNFDQSVDQSMRVQNPVDIVTHVPMILEGYVHVKGMLKIPPQFDNFHSLWGTYLPGLLSVIRSAQEGGRSPELLGSEEEALTSHAAELQPA